MPFISIAWTGLIGEMKPVLYGETVTLALVSMMRGTMSGLIGVRA
jgi:hypothetical protein